MTLRQIYNRLQGEYIEFKEGTSNLHFVDSIERYQDNEYHYHWKVIFNGPPNTPYSGGKFVVDMQYNSQYNARRPKTTKLLTKMFHINVSEDGEKVGLYILEDISHWKPYKYESKDILHGIYNFMLKPNTKCVKNEKAFELYEKDNKKYNDIAAEWTKKYAIIENDNKHDEKEENNQMNINNNNNNGKNKNKNNNDEKDNKENSDSVNENGAKDIADRQNKFVDVSIGDFPLLDIDDSDKNEFDIPLLSTTGLILPKESQTEKKSDV